MHSFWQRLNAIFFYCLSLLGFLSFCAAGTTYWHVAEPQITLSLKKLSLRKIHGAGHDQAIMHLGIDADLRSVFNWNVKQLFVYITAEYETSANVLNQVVVWDKIISDKRHAHIKSTSVANKYSLTDQGFGLRDNNVTLALSWNIVPSTGLLGMHHGYSDAFSFDVPDEYTSTTKADNLDAARLAAAKAARPIT
jgi:signal peptidase complex subunit 3